MAEIEDLKTLSYTSAGTNDPNTDISAPNPNAGTWGPGEEITINKLNHMDTGIVNATEGVKTLAQAIDSLDVPNITGLTQDMTNVKSTLEAAKGTHASMLARLNNMEGSIPTAQSLTTQITAAVSADATVSSMSDEIQNAHRTGSELVNPANNYVDSLDSRFDDIEAVLRSKTNNSKGINLNARFIALEAAIETITGSDVDSGSLTALAARIAVLENALKSALDSDEDNVWKTLDDYLSDLEQDVADLKAEVGQFDSSRIDALEAEVEAAHRTLDGGATDSLDNRFDDAEDRLTALEASIGDNEGNSLSGRVAALESVDADNRLDNLETIIGNDDPATGLQAIAAEVVAARGESANLDARLDTLAVAATVNSALETKAAAADLTALTGRVTTLEGKDTIVVNKPATGSNYTNDVPNIDSPSANADYLIQADDDKYYYWRYINGTWQMISGAGGGGTGNNSAKTYGSLESFEADIVATAPDKETDYYVFQSDNYWHHYRYLANESSDTSTWTRIEIGQILDPDNINKYNVEKIYNEKTEKNYLKLYQYDYGMNNGIDTDISAAIKWEPSTSYQVDDLVVYTDGYTYQCRTANNDAEWNANKWQKISNIRTLQVIELPEGGGGTSSNIVNKLTRIGDQTIQKIVNSKVFLRVFYSSWNIEDSESSSGSFVLMAGNKQIDSGTLNSGAKDVKPADWVVVDDAVFENNVPVITNPDTIKLYLIKQNDEYSTWTYDGSDWSSTSGAPAGFYEFDVTNYCHVGPATTFNLNVNVEGTPLSKTWNVNIVDLRLETTAPEVLLIPHTEAYDFPYTAFGALSKTLHVIIDNDKVHETLVNLAATTSGRATQITIPAQEHGVHKLEFYLTASVGGVLQTTDSIIREYIWFDEENEDVPLLIASPQDKQTITAQQYSTIEIPYQVYKKGAAAIEVEYYLDNNVTPFGSVTLENTNTGVLTYLATEKGAHTLTIKVDDATVSTTLNITKLDIDISPVDGAIINFDPTTLENNSVNRLPSWTVGQTEYKMTSSDNFNWSDDSNGGGYKKDADGKALVIKAGTYIDLTYPLFASINSTDILTRGTELKLIFKTKAVRQAKAVWLSSVGKMYNKDVGLELGVHSGWIKTTRAADTNVVIEPDENGVIAMNGVNYNIWKPNVAYAVNDIVVLWDKNDDDNHQLIFRCIKAWDNTHATFLNAKGKVQSDYWLSIGKISTEVAANDSYLYLSYSEQDKIELDINIDKTAQFIMAYEDGVPSKVYAYSVGTGGDGLQHNNTIRIGSDDCDVYLYGLRIYNKSLTTANILQNFIADGRDINEKVQRYNRNCIYWDPTQNDGAGAYFPSPSVTATLDPLKLAEAMPDVKVLMLDTPIFTTSKKDFVMNSTLRCIHADGGNVYTSRGDADNWFFTNGFHSGQGTTSDNYGQSARNVDFLFEVDAKHWPTKSKNMGSYKVSENPNYKSTVYVGEDASAWDAETETWVPTREPKTIEICNDWKEDNCKVGLTETSVPNNYFNLKVNVASSENVNNALFQKRYDDFLVYTSPAQTNQIAKHRELYRALGQDPSKIKVKNSMEFVPAVLFIRENEPDTSKHVEFNDCKWHFYALGNIGDSKKTDYTRAYDPDDINEFTCENSDNNTNNGQFQSGVFNYNGHEAIETDYRAWNETTAYEQGAIVVYDGVIYSRSGATQADLGENETYTWVANEWAAITYTGWTDSKLPYFAPRTNPNSMEYIFPITPSQWNVQFNGEYLNRKHKTLVEEEFDGDHSFEFRYACRGDYRDGDLINDTSDTTDVPNTDPETKAEKPYLTEDDIQFDLNHDVVLAFYEWVITATPEQYKAEASQWIVKSAMEFFYAYTHYYTMMDNRAKNTFWHFAKTGTYIEVSRPVKELLHVYEESSDNGATWTKATGTTISASKKYRTQYAFDLWAYDMDTAAGIDNNGQLSFPYGKEDDDYRVENTPTSGYAFNGAGSIFWRRLKTTFADEIAQVMNTAQRCFRAEDLITEFDKFQNCFPEEIWRLDIERKYIRTFTGESIDDSITIGKKNPRFLTAMMQGRKKYQRRQWIRNQSLYFNSKYRLSDVTVATNTTEFNVITPANANDPNIAVIPNYDLKLVPYQDMYINVTIGNGGPTPSKRVKAGETYILPIADYTSANFGETRIYIYGFSGISEIGNLASMYPYSFTLNALDHLKKLDMGTDASGYVNANLTSLPLTKDTELPLLEEINIKNCHSLSGGLTLSQANNLRIVEAAGTTITGIDLPQYTNIETLHLPSTVTDLVLYGARQLTDLQITNNNTGVIDYTGLFNLNIYDSDYSSTVNWLDIATTMLKAGVSISLSKLKLATIGEINELEPLAEAKQNGQTIDLSGTISVTGAWSLVEKESYEDLWSQLLHLSVIDDKEQTKHKVTYSYDDYEDDEGNIIKGQEIKTLYINNNDPLIDIWEYTENEQKVHILDEMPSRASTVKTVYQFGLRQFNQYIELSGWKIKGEERPIRITDDDPGMNVTTNLELETYFKQDPKTYLIKWYLEKNNDGSPKLSTLVKTSGNAVNYGGGYEQEAPTVDEIHAKGLSTASVTVDGQNVQYSIFEGWEKLPTNIAPTINDTDYNIFAKWSSGSTNLTTLFSDVSTITPEQLLVLSAVSNKTGTAAISNKIAVGTQFNYTVGNDSIRPGVELIGPNATRHILRTDLGNTTYTTNIQPFGEESNAFTLAIDYCFNENALYDNSTKAAILMSCYSIDPTTHTAQGFALYDNLDTTLANGGALGPRFGFGDMFSELSRSVAIGNELTRGQRNIIVIRHPQDSQYLYVYSGKTGSTSLETAVSSQFPAAWSNNRGNGYLTFGQLTNSSSSDYEAVKSITANAKGTIYWAKYWNEDLGIGECKRIAAWPHENISYIVSLLKNQPTAGERAATTSVTPSVVLTTTCTSAHGNIIQQNANTAKDSVTGWATSEARKVCNNILFQGLPTKLQAILCKPSIKTYDMVVSSDNDMNVYKLSSIPTITRDYLYLSSAINLGKGNVSAYINEEDEANARPYGWLASTSSIQVYDYNPTATSSSHWSTATATSNDYGFFYYKLLRFPNKSFTWSTDNKLRVFRESGATLSASTTIYSEINTIDGGIKENDIYINSAGIAYIYVSDTAVTSEGVQYEPKTGIFYTENGGWLKASEYWTRSMGYGNNKNNYIYVRSNGPLETNATSSASANGLAINYSLSI